MCLSPWVVWELREGGSGLGVSINLAVELWLEAGYLQVRIPFCEVFVVVVETVEYASASYAGIDMNPHACLLRTLCYWSYMEMEPRAFCMQHHSPIPPSGILRGLSPEKLTMRSYMGMMVSEF